MEYLFENDAYGNIEGAIGSTDTSITLESGHGDRFPSPGADQGFYAVLEEGDTYEWIVCTSRSGDVLTVTRGASPSAFSDGVRIELRMNDTVLNQFVQNGVFRTVTSDPDGSLAANYSGEEVYQSVTGVWWKHCTSTTWKEMNL